MRKINAVISALVLILFIAHGIYGAFVMTDITAGGTFISTMLSHLLLLTLTSIHALIGIVLTVKSIFAMKKSGVFYFKENKRFLAVRISGIAIMCLIAAHVVLFMGKNEESFRLNLFDEASLVMSLFLVLSIAVHIICNIAPLFMSLGLVKLRAFAGDILFILSALCLLFGIGFLIYYVRWL